MFLKLTNFNLINARLLKSFGIYDFYFHFEAMTEDTKRRQEKQAKNGGRG